MNLAGKVALVTGASSGIGAATAKLFGRLGAAVTLSGRKEDQLISVANETAAKDRTFCVAVDLTKEHETKRLVDEALNHYKRLDILVNCAGVIERGSVEETSLEQFDRVMNINVRSIYHLITLCAPYLIESRGSIVNVSSVNGIRSFPGLIAYNTSKAAVDHLTRCAALDLASKGVRVNAVNPGVTVTNLHKRGGMDEEAYEAFLDHSRSTHALGRPGQAEEVAQAIAFLADQKLSSFITGVTVPVDGGRHAMCPR